MLKYNLKSHQWDKVQNAKMQMKFNLVHAMPTAGKSAFVGSASRLGADWVDTDDLITIAYSWPVWDYSRNDNECHHTVIQGALLTANLLAASTGCKIITNLTLCTPDVSFGRSAELMRSMYAVRAEQKHGPKSQWTEERKRETEKRLAEMTSWYENWVSNIEKWQCPAYLLEEGEYLCTAFGLQPDTSTNPKTHAILRRVLDSLDPKIIRGNEMKYFPKKDDNHAKPVTK